MIVKHRRGTTKEWQEVDLIPEEGEIVIEECIDGTLKCKIGTGYTKFSKLPYIDDKTRLTLLQEITKTRTNLEQQLTTVSESLSFAIVNAKQELSNAITAKCSELAANLAKDFASGDATIKAELADSITSTVKTAKDSMSTELKNAIKEVNNAKAELQVDLETKLANATTSVKTSLEAGLAGEKLERETAVASLQQTIADTETAVMAEITAGISTVVSDTNKRIDSVVAKADAALEALAITVSELKYDVNNELAEHANELNNLDSKIDNTTKSCTDQVEALAGSVKVEFEAQAAGFDKKLAEVTSEYDNQLLTVAQSLQSKIDSASTLYSSNLNTLRDDIEEATTTIDTQISTLNGLYNELHQADASLLAAIDTKASELSGDYTYRDTLIAEDFNNKLIVAVSTLREESKTNTTTQAGQAQENLTKLEQQLNTAIEDSIAELRASFTTDLSAERATTAAEVNTLQQKVTSAEASISSISNKVISLEAGQAAEILRVKTSLIDALNTKSEELAEDFTSRYDELTTSFTELENTVETLRTETATTAKQLADSTEEGLAELALAVTDSINSKTTFLENSIADEKADRESAVSGLQKDITDLEENINNKIEKAAEDLTSTLSAQINNIAKKAEADAEDLAAALIDSKSELEKTITQKLNEQSSGFDVKLSGKAAELTTDYEAKIEIAKNQLQESINSAGHAQSSEVNTLKTATEKSIEDICLRLIDFGTVHSQLSAADTALSDALAKLEQKGEAADNAILVQVNTLKDNIAGVAIIVEALESKVDSADTKLSRDIENVALALHGAVSEISNRITASEETRDQNLADQVASLNTYIEELVATASQELSTKIEDLRSTINLKFINVQHDVESIAHRVVEVDYLTNNKLVEFEGILTENKADLEAALSTVDQRFEELNSDIEITNTKIETQAKRINGIIALPDGSTTADAELIDIRHGYNNIDYESAGDAVRAIGHDLDELKASLPSYIPANAVDGLLYENNQLWLTSNGVEVGVPVTITGGSGGGGSVSTVRVTNNLPSNSFTISKGNDMWIDFTYTSFENEVPTGDGAYSIIINDKKIDKLSGSIQHGVAKRLNIAEYLKNGSNSIKVVCSDQYGSSRSLVYTISVVELRIESTFDSTKIFDSNITFRYTIFGQAEKTVYVYVDDEEISKKSFGANVNNTSTTLTIPKQAHGAHVIVAYIEATVGDDAVRSNELTYEIMCVEEGIDKEAILVSNGSIGEITQGDLVSIPYMVYDPNAQEAIVNLNVYSKVGGVLTKIDKYCTTRKVDCTSSCSQQFWNTRQYPTGNVVFEVSYTYTYFEEERTISKTYDVNIAELEVGVTPESDSLQLYLTAVGKSNDVENPGVWEFTRNYLDEDGEEAEETITTAFENFNWCSNGWFTDANGDTYLRLNGDARAEINFKPFEKDFKANGKTIEFEFIVRDVNNREAIVIDCFEAEVDQATGKETGKGIGFRATPDTAFLKSSDTEVSCRYKDNERVRVAISVESDDTSSKFVSIYLDGVLSGVQHYTASTTFNQSRSPQKIKLGSPYCGLDIYNIRIYDKALTTADILKNYIADQTVPTVKQQLLTDNSILDESGNVSYDLVKKLGKIPFITFTGAMPTYKDDKKVVKMDFENPLDPARSFSNVYGGPIQVEIDVQGTSSQYYVRKNWKIKLKKKDKNGNTIFDNAAYQHMEGQIPAKVFCIKVDYAEATGTHNTGTANYVETFYDRSEALLPPQKDDERVRTTIAGFPCIIFEKATEDSEPVFSSKGNFNYDKGAEEAFGFTKDYKDFGVECWEFKNNTSDAVNFAGEIPDNWLDDFEPRYTPKDFDRIEELQKLANKGTITAAQQSELESIRADAITNFKEMHDWVVSTATFDLEQTLDANGEVIGSKKIPLSAEERQVRLDKFKNEFENYFNMHYSSIYYVYTFFALMTDQRAKNMFLTRWKDDDGKHRWYPYFYDNDTIFGINNEGALVFDYYHEDTDQLGSSNVYNGQNSVLWNNFRECFQDKIQETYAKLRSDKKLDYDAIVDSYITKGSDKWSAAIYNADADYKYVSMARAPMDHTDEEGNKVEGLDASNLYQVRGPGEHHLRYFAANRLNYCDSKWNAGDYPSDFFFLRIYTPQLAEITDDMSEARKEELRMSNARIEASLAAVPANPNITVTPFSDMYAGVKYKANGTLQQERLTANETYEFAPPNANETFNDTETAIYGASSLASLGDLSGLYCGVINLVGKNSSNASAVQGNVKENKLVELVIGNESPDYHNDNFKEIEVGTCRLLQKIDLRNCSGLGIAGANPQKTLNLTGCPNIEEIYTEGTNLTLVELPDGGYVKTLHLPASTNTLVIKNQQYISDFQIESYANVRTLQIENSNLNTAELLENCRDRNGKYTVVNVSLTDVQLGTEDDPVTVGFIKSLFAVYNEEGELLSGIRGLGDDKQAYIKGTCYIEELSGEDYAEIKSYYKDLAINFDRITSAVSFRYKDTSGIDHVETREVTGENSQAGSIAEFIPESTPFWPENDAFTYEFVGWSQIEQLCKLPDDTNLDEDGKYENDEWRKEHPDASNQSSLTGILGNRILYPVFKAIRKSYNVTFVNPTAQEDARVIGTIEVPYGNTADYSKLGLDLPKKLDAAETIRDLYAIGWYSTEGTIEYITKDLTFEAQFEIADQDGPNGDDADTAPGYTISWADIGTYYDAADKTNKLGYTLNTGNSTMTITKCINAFNSVLKIPNILTAEGISYDVTGIGGLYNGSFVGTDKLTLVYLPDTLVYLYSNAFADCNKLYEIKIPASVQSISDTAFIGCSGLTNITIADGNTNYRVENDCLIDKTNKLVLGLSTSSIPDSVTSLGNYCFHKMPITTAVIPEGISVISNNAFSSCTSLTNVTLPSSLTTLEATCFAWCSSLSEITLPTTLTSISSYVFDACALESVEIPSKVGSIGDRAFGDMSSLTTVTFISVDKIPDIHYQAFINSGPTEFRLPWSKEDHRKFIGTYSENSGGAMVERDKDIFFGAKVGSKLIFTDGEIEKTSEVHGDVL